MNKCRVNPNKAFTLIELLVVIAIIAALAAMIFPVTAAVQRAKVRSKARAELSQVATWIEAYKVKMGHYPPDNPNRLGPSPLFFELAGTTLQSGAFRTLDGSGVIGPVPAQVLTTFGVSGFVNSSRGASEDGPNAKKFIDKLSAGQTGEIANDVRVLTSTVRWPDTSGNWFLVPGLNPIRYNSSNPTNNPGSYDLWIDVVVSGKTNRISNWSKVPLFVGTRD